MLILQRNKESACAGVALAMLLGRDYRDLGLPNPLQIVFRSGRGHRGIAIHDLKVWGFKNGYAIVDYDRSYIMRNECGEDHEEELDIKQFLSQPCILFIRQYNGIGHAVAWNPEEKKVYDPKGFIYNLEELPGEIMHVCTVQKVS